MAFVSLFESRAKLTPLDLVNFFLADVRGGLGAYLNIYLLTAAKWSPAAIGAVLAASGLTGVLAHPAVGALIDRTRTKRALIIGGGFILSACGLFIMWMPTLPVVLAADLSMAILGGVFAPTIAAITLGVCDKEHLAARLGRNAVFDRAGNIFIAGVIWLVGMLSTQAAPFFLAPAFALLTAVATLSIPVGAIDYRRARGLTGKRGEKPSGWRLLLARRPLVVFAAATALFHFANSTMLLLLLQELALAYPGWETSLTSAALMISQLATAAAALLVTRADAIGRRPLLLMSIAALFLQGFLCMLSIHPISLLAVQVLDGAGGGLFDALLPLILADLVKGTGRYSLARGVLGTIQGIGGAASQLATGLIVTAAGYPLAFLTLIAGALAAFVLVFLALPETAPARRDNSPLS